LVTKKGIYQPKVPYFPEGKKKKGRSPKIRSRASSGKKEAKKARLETGGGQGGGEESSGRGGEKDREWGMLGTEIARNWRGKKRLFRWGAGKET